MSLPLPVPHPTATKKERRGVLTGTDMKRLMDGDWRSVWNEKRGLVEAPDLSQIWKPRLGLETEKLHAWWHQKETGNALQQMPDRPCILADTTTPIFAATFDYWVGGEDDCPLELKHTNERNNLYEAAQYYMAQLQWQLKVSGRSQLRFSIIRGNNEPEWGTISRDEQYVDRLTATAITFWKMVEGDIPPEESTPPDEAAKTVAKSIPINGLKAYDHSTNNEWLVIEARYVEQKLASDAFKSTDKEIRTLIPADALEVQGKLTRFKRDARGAYRCTILEGGDA